MDSSATMDDSNAEVLSRLYSSIPPDFNAFGTFVSDEHFLASFDLYINMTRESKNLVDLCKEEVLPFISSKRSMVDVGPGSYRMVRELGEEFTHFTLIDTNAKILSLADSLPTCFGKIVHKQHSSIVDARLEPESIDLAMLVHILYYIDRSEWMEVTDKLYASLTEGGKLFVSLGGDLSKKMDLHRHFSVKFLDVTSYTQDCLTKYEGKVKLYHTVDTTTARNLESMLHCAGFLLGDSQGEAKSVTREDLSVYLNANCRQADGTYMIDSQITTLVITKPFRNACEPSLT